MKYCQLYSLIHCCGNHDHDSPITKLASKGMGLKCIDKAIAKHVRIV